MNNIFVSGCYCSRGDHHVMFVSHVALPIDPARITVGPSVGGLSVGNSVPPRFAVALTRTKASST